MEQLPWHWSAIPRGIFGLVVIVALAYLFSSKKKDIDWALVGKGMLFQIILALAIFKFQPVYWVFDGIAQFFIEVLNFTEKGAVFVFGAWPDWLQVYTPSEDGQALHTIGYVFAFKVLPTIVFFAALSSLLYYLGILQKIVYGLAWVMSKVMRLSGAESLAAAANVFIGQTEAPLIVKPYLENMTKSEIMCLMTGGMATIAGGVFAAFVGFLGDEYAFHLLTASVISAPAAIVMAKILYPEDKDIEINTDLDISKEKIGSNVLDAIANGTTDGIKLAVNVGAMLLVFIAMIAMVNYVLTDMIGCWTGLNQSIGEVTGGTYNVETCKCEGGKFEGFSLEYIFGLFFAPFAWILGVPWSDALVVGELLGTKTVINEFVAFASLKSSILGFEKSKIIAAYALCGFANFSSIGIQIGGIGAIAPSQRKTLSQFGIKALIGGTLACFATAAIAGMFY
ncbi:MAG: Na+ dependent nucleoside transporter [Flavobacteriales bacterium]|nr:Na+ dependent nucleoside transporter [Flavobacteriales bacterium]